MKNSISWWDRYGDDELLPVMLNRFCLNSELRNTLYRFNEIHWCFKGGWWTVSDVRRWTLSLGRRCSVPFPDDISDTKIKYQQYVAMKEIAAIVLIQRAWRKCR